MMAVGSVSGTEAETDEVAVNGAALLRAFEAGAIDPAEFSHQQHLRVAFEMLKRFSWPETLERFARGLKLLAAKARKPQIYHETKTVAFLALIAERLERIDNPSWPKFNAANQDLFDRLFLNKFYRRRELDSPRARRVFLLPQPSRVRGGFEMATVAETYAIALALGLICASVLTLREQSSFHQHAGILATLEIAAASLFCFRRSRTIGLVALLLILAGATVSGLARGEMPVRFVIYAASALAAWMFAS